MDMLYVGILAGIVIAALVFGCMVVCMNDEPDNPNGDMDAETATLSLKNVKHDLKNVLSTKEIKAIDYAIESIDIRYKVETWLDRWERKIKDKES